MKKVSAFVILIATALLISISAHARGVNKDLHITHEMQHGFIISDDELFFSHLVANGHHSHQLSFAGRLSIQDAGERKFFLERKKLNATDKKSYFLFQAQQLNLPLTTNGQVLTGHIVESPTGDYTPQNIIVRDAKIKVEKVHINVVNPFFIE